MYTKFMTSKENFKLLDYSPNGVFVLDSSMTVLFWNKELESWTGIYSKEIVGKRVGEFFPYLEAEPFKSDLKKIFVGEGNKIYSSKKSQTVIEHKSASGEAIDQKTIVSGMDSDVEGQFLALFTLKDDETDLDGNVPESKPGTGTILVIDDENAIRLAISRVLANHGYGVRVAKSGEEALEHIEKGIDGLKAVILDMMMPGMNGFETLPHLRRKLANIPIVVCTGMPLEEFEARNIRRYVQGVVLKPFGASELLQILKKSEDIEIKPLPLLEKASDMFNAPSSKAEEANKSKGSSDDVTESSIKDKVTKVGKSEGATTNTGNVVIPPPLPGERSNLKLKR